MAPTNLEFNHVMLYVQDVRRSLEFYRDLLGFAPIEVWSTDYARLRAPKGRSTIALHVLGMGEEAVSKEGVRLYFEVKDLDALCDRLAKAGVKFEQMPMDMEWGWRHAYLSDPDGHALSLYWAGEKRLKETH